MDSLFQSIAFLLLFACIGALTHIIASYYHFFTQPLPIAKPFPLYHTLSVFGIYILSQIVLANFIFYLLSLVSPALTIKITVIGFFITSLITLILILLYGYAQKNLNFSEIWKSEKSHSSIGHDILLGIVTLIICYPVISFVNSFFEFLVTLIWGKIHFVQTAVYFFKWASSNPFSTTLAILVIGIIGPIVEELLYRGFLQTYLRAKCGSFKAIFITSIFFALAHYSLMQSYGNIVIITSIFVFSLYLGYLYEKTGSLYSNISLHVTFNCASVIRMIIE